MQQDSVKLARDLKHHMDERGATQSEIAESAGVDQATVSRFLNLKKPPQRVTGPHRVLCNYAIAALSPKRDEGRREAVHKSFDECWNRSPAHANAISKIIDAFVELCKRDWEENTSSWPKQDDSETG